MLIVRPVEENLFATLRFPEVSRRVLCRSLDVTGERLAVGELCADRPSEQPEIHVLPDV